MSDMKYPSFRLFGRNIQATKVYNHDYDDNLCDYESINSNTNSKHDENRANYEKNSREKQRNRSHSTVTEDAKTVSNAKDVSDGTSSTTKSINQNYLKKPDKILPCPRCSSMATKFCYFNNYNVNQPRHFCKNCQRYWTAGGTVRNIPVGAGRRKNRNSNSKYGENEVNFQTPPYTWNNNNPMRWQSRFPMSSTPSSSDGTRLFFGTFDDDEMKGGNGRIVRAKTITEFDDLIDIANSSIGNTLTTVKNNRHGSSSSSSNTITKTQTRSFGIPQQQYNGNGVHDSSRTNPAAYSRSLLFQ